MLAHTHDLITPHPNECSKWIDFRSKDVRSSTWGIIFDREYLTGVYLEGSEKILLTIKLFRERSHIMSAADGREGVSKI